MRREQNELLTRTGPGSEMGNLFRQFWMPAALSEEILTPDCSPIRVPLLGERLIAFRDTIGRPGVLDARCPHRRADLFFGRNEESGIRCVYHGWKFDTSGQCVDQPSEPAEFKDRVRATAYPVVEHGGIVWTRLGGEADPSTVPDFDFASVPPQNRFVSKCLMRCNYLQAVEGSIDTAHLSFLHRNLKSGQSDVFGVGSLIKYSDDDGRPTFLVDRTPYGLRIVARRDAGEDSYYWRISHWLMPFYVLVPTAADLVQRANLFVPIDDVSCWWYRVRWHSNRPLSAKEVDEFKTGGDYAELIPGTYYPTGNRENDYLIDRHDQRVVSFTGIRSAQLQDIAIQESQGEISDRENEILGTTDLGIVHCRRSLMDASASFAAGTSPAAALNGGGYRQRAVAFTAPRNVPLEELLARSEVFDVITV